MTDSAEKPPSAKPDPEQLLFEETLRCVGTAYTALSRLLDYALTPKQDAQTRGVMQALNNFRLSFMGDLRKLPRTAAQSVAYETEPSGGGGFSVNEKPHVSARRLCGLAWSCIWDWFCAPNRMTADQRALAEQAMQKLLEFIETDFAEWKQKPAAKSGVKAPASTADEWNAAESSALIPPR